MKILLLDNAIDSFEWSLRHLKTFLQMDCKFEHPDTSTTYLKQAILCLNSALELFFKERISVINPLLIYEHISTDALPQVIVDYYAKEENGEIDEPLYNYVIENTELHTIDYSKCIELYCSFYSIAQGHKENFIELNSMRNQLTHLGINSEEEYYILAGRIADILNFVHYNILRKINYLPTKIEEICLEIFCIEGILASLEESIWRIANENRIEEICNYIVNLSQSKEIQDYMEEKNVIADFGTTFDAEYMRDVLFGMGAMEDVDLPFPEVFNPPMFVLTNKQKVDGAAVVLFDDVLKAFAKKHGNFYVIFSSIHEALLIPDDYKLDLEHLTSLNVEVNDTQVACDEILGTKAYFYDEEKGFVIK